ncbi:hypothetical protein APR50_14475 [Variovorax paradoxus]|nr:hypothetical protein APR49_40100 [Variovorax paradoxus]KPU96998.1 hypothetical protein APR52_12260 [Variovorax paradoxus]KPV07417.1 hypothetical protein APR50_14475 [Variovorax paradoxus]KPV14221.1 hypothetical protein APR51_40175 [Variovorax paradoxus]KPV16962.1 hypothetical protein APR48_42400 [Variovorax paradoxus]
MALGLGRTVRGEQSIHTQGAEDRISFQLHDLGSRTNVRTRQFIESPLDELAGCAFVQNEGRVTGESERVRQGQLALVANPAHENGRNGLRHMLDDHPLDLVELGTAITQRDLQAVLRAACGAHHEPHAAIAAGQPMVVKAAQ